METDKRQFVRKRTDQLLYAEFGPDNGSILLNLSEQGCSFQSIAPVRAERVRFSVSVGDGRKLEGDGQMVWSDTAKKTGGVRFLNPSWELREQVRAWLNQTLVTTDGKLDPVAVESEAKRRRRKLREEAKAAERARKEGALKGNRAETSGEGGGPVSHLALPGNPTTNESRNPIAGDDSTSRLAYGDSAATVRRIGMIALAAILCVTLMAYRRELGHLVMSVGSSIAGEEGKGRSTAPAEARPTSVEASSEVKPAAMRDAPETASEASADAGNNRSEESVGTEQSTRPADVPIESARRVAAQQERGMGDVASLWTSVENGDTAAEVTLASRYVRGDGVPQSCAQARVLLEAAVKRGSLEAKQKLGELGQAGCP